MTAIHKNDESEQYLAPRCRVYTVALESVIAQSIPGTIPDDEIVDEEDED